MKEGLPQKTETNQTATTALETRWRALCGITRGIANEINSDLHFEMNLLELVMRELGWVWQLRSFADCLGSQ
jgi:hypothetical protein